MFRSSIDSNLQTQYFKEKETILLSRLIKLFICKMTCVFVCAMKEIVDRGID